jgi:hypothetical protein
VIDGRQAPCAAIARTGNAAQGRAWPVPPAAATDDDLVIVVLTEKVEETR